MKEKNYIRLWLIYFLTWLALYWFSLFTLSQSSDLLEEWKQEISSVRADFNSFLEEKAKSIVHLKEMLNEEKVDENSLKRIMFYQCTEAYKLWVKLNVLEDETFHYACFETYDDIVYKETLNK